MLIASYDQSDGYWTEESIKDQQTDFPGEYDDIEPGDYDEHVDAMYYNDFKYNVKEAFAKRKFPLVLAARKSNWRGQDGFAEAHTINDVLQKVASFDSGSVELHRGAGGSLWFSMGGTHDVPTGFTIEVKPHNKAYWSD